MSTQRARSAATLTSLEAQDRFSTQIARMTPALDPAAFAALMRADKLAAAAFLSNLSPEQLVTQAIHHATWINESYGFSGYDALLTEEVLLNFQHGVMVYRNTRVAPEPTPAPAPVAPPTTDQRPTVNLPAGKLELDDRTLQAAYGIARSQRELMTARWQNALKRGYEHLEGDAAIGVRADGAYFWWGDEGGDYQPTPARCTCPAFENDNPCKHRGAAIVLSFYAEAQDSFSSQRRAA